MVPDRSSYNSNQNRDMPQHILSSATHWDLMAAKNEAYCMLYNNHIKEKCQGEVQR